MNTEWDQGKNGKRASGRTTSAVSRERGCSGIARPEQRIAARTAVRGRGAAVHV